MRTIYVVYFDWAFNGGSDQGYVGIYERKEDAINRMERYWEDEKRMDYFEKFDVFDDTEMTRTAWTDYEYSDRHSEVRVYEETLYSHDDILNDLDV